MVGDMGDLKLRVRPSAEAERPDLLVMRCPQQRFRTFVVLFDLTPGDADLHGSAPIMRRLSANGVAVHSIFLSLDRASGAHLWRRLASHFAGWFAFAHTDKDGVAKEPVLRPRQ